MRVLVTGGAGYIGAHMVRALSQAGEEPVVFDNLSTGHKAFVPKGVPFILGDLKNPEDIGRAIQQYPIQAVMHFAASCLVGESVEKPLKYYENNVVAFLNLLDAMRRSRVDKLIFSSTCAVFGEPKRIPIREEDTKHPTNPYGQSKLVVENILRYVSTTEKLRYVALRYFNACGAHESAEIGEEHDPETHLIPNVLKVASGQMKKLTIYGDDYKTPDGTCIRDYVHVNDLCQAHLLALRALKKGMKSDSFNLGNGHGYSVKQIVEAAQKITGKKIKCVVGPRRPGDPARLVAASAKAKKILGWKPKASLEEILESAWRWEKKV